MAPVSSLSHRESDGALQTGTCERDRSIWPRRTAKLPNGWTARLRLDWALGRPRSDSGVLESATSNVHSSQTSTAADL